MSNLIKQNHADSRGAIGAFRSRTDREESASQTINLFSPAPSAEQRALELAAAEIEGLRDQITNLSQRSREEIDDAYQRGRDDALSTLEKEESANLATLSANMAAGLEDLQAKFAQLDKTALDAVLCVLDHLLVDNQQTRFVVKQNLAAVFKRFEETMILGITMSGHDFSKQESLEFIQNLNENRHFDVCVSKTLPAGSFELEMRLGTLEFSLSESLDEVKTLFAEVLRGSAPQSE